MCQSLTLRADAVASMARRTATIAGLPGFVSAAARASRGSALFMISSRLALSSGMKNDEPVTFPPGRGRLATTPLSTGVPTIVITTGISVVVCFAARAAGVPWVTMMSTLRRISSAANTGSRSYLPSAHRSSRVTFLPST